MSLELNSISSFKVKGKPGFDSILSNIQKWSKKLEENIEMENNNLSIFCIQGLFDYRTGFVGMLLNLFGYQISKYVSSRNNIRNIFNTDSSDYELFTFTLCILTRIVPINNIWNFNAKNFINSRFYTDDNLSEPSIFDMKSIFLLKPLFDSGCMIYSNKKPTKSGFEKLPILDRFRNKGITWSYFESDRKGVMIMNIDFETVNDISIQLIMQLIEIKDLFEIRNTTLIDDYETYIVGNFNVYFNLKNVIPEIGAMYDMLSKSNIYIISENDHPTTTDFIMYSKYDKKIGDENVFNYTEYDGVSKIKNVKDSYVTSYNPLFNVDIELSEIKIVKDEVVKDEVVKDEVVKDEVVKDEVVKDEVIKDEVVKDEVIMEEIRINDVLIFDNMNEKYFEVEDNHSIDTDEGWENL